MNNKLLTFDDGILLKTVLESMVDGLIVIDKTGIILSVNKATTANFGYEPEELIGKNVKILMPEPYHSAHDEYINHYLITGEKKIIGIGRELRARHKNGSIFPIELGINEMVLGNEQLFVGTLRNISVRKKLEQQLIDEAQRLGTIMNTVLDGLITIDPLGSIESFNHSAERIFGYTLEEVLGKNVKMLMPEPYNGSHDNYLSHYLSSGEKKVIGIGREVSALRKDGTEFPMELGINEMVLDGKRKFVGTIRDISERKKNEAVIANYIDDLNHSNKELDDFAYIASHDLKEPLRGLSNNATFLKEDYENKLDSGALKRLNRMIHLCERMELLVDDLLNYSRLSRQEIGCQKTDLNKVIDRVKDMMLETLNEKKAHILVKKTLPHIKADEVLLTEVFRNLITNGIKYNNNVKKIIEIGLTRYDARNNKLGVLCLYVHDNGIGIPEEFHYDVFSMFKRLNSESEDTRGSGVGLAFVKKIIERHKGSIWIDSSLGRGSTFYFTLEGLKELHSDAYF